ncbi:MAG: diguanylate cyclase domain-containing protein [Coriobacteriales bacterium]
MNPLKSHLAVRIGVTLAAMALLLGLSAVVAKTVSTQEEQNCWDTLSYTASYISEDLVTQLNTNEELLDCIGDIIEDMDSLSSPRVKRVIDGFKSSTTFSYIALLLPGDKVMLPGKGVRSSSGILSFEEEAAKGKHVSDRSVAIADQSVQAIRIFVPVEKGGETIAMLYGLIDLNAYSAEVGIDPYAGEGAVFVIDGNTGDFIVDSWHDRLGNMDDLGLRQTKPGYSQEQLKEDTREGRAGHCVFVSESGGSSVYFCYQPVPVNNWSIALSVSEDVAFAQAKRTNAILTGFFVFEILVLAAYFVFILFSTRRELREKQQLAERDVLTGLYNRNSYEEHIQVVGQQCKERLVCAYVDANGLHVLNNTKGHTEGDRMLKAVGRALKGAFANRSVFRIGGDEFAFFVPDGSEQEVADVLEHIAACLEQEGYSISYGVACLELPLDVDDLIRLAEKRMYEQKRRHYAERGEEMRSNTRED